ncbi:hypothetical protein SAZ11_11005 [Streptomyces sp. FXJ1.4098]|nr:hypothetical protein [Streptomyces sp. FXJ1.4098]
MAVGLALFGGPVAVAATSATSASAGHHAEATSSTVMDYYQYFGHYTTMRSAWPSARSTCGPQPRRADAYECRPRTVAGISG